MDLTPEMIEQLKADLKTAKTYQDLMGENGTNRTSWVWKIFPSGKNTGDSRNGKTHKTLKNDKREIELTVPRDRNGSFDRVVVKKYERTLGPIEDKISLPKEWPQEIYNQTYKNSTSLI